MRVNPLGALGALQNRASQPEVAFGGKKTKGAQWSVTADAFQPASRPNAGIGQQVRFDNAMAAQFQAIDAVFSAEIHYPGQNRSKRNYFYNAQTGKQQPVKPFGETLKYLPQSLRDELVGPFLAKRKPGETSFAEKTHDHVQSFRLGHVEESVDMLHEMFVLTLIRQNQIDLDKKTSEILGYTIGRAMELRARPKKLIQGDVDPYMDDIRKHIMASRRGQASVTHTAQLFANVLGRDVPNEAEALNFIANTYVRIATLDLENKIVDKKGRPITPLEYTTSNLHSEWHELRDELKDRPELAEVYVRLEAKMSDEMRRLGTKHQSWLEALQSPEKRERHLKETLQALLSAVGQSVGHPDLSPEALMEVLRRKFATRQAVRVATLPDRSIQYAQRKEICKIIEAVIMAQELERFAPEDGYPPVPGRHTKTAQQPGPGLPLSQRPDKKLSLVF